MEQRTSCYLLFLLFTGPGKHQSTPALSLCSTAGMGRPDWLVPSRKPSPVLQTPAASVSPVLMSCTSSPLHIPLPKSLQYPCISHANTSFYPLHPLAYRASYQRDWKHLIHVRKPKALNCLRSQHRKSHAHQGLLLAFLCASDVEKG